MSPFATRRLAAIHVIVSMSESLEQLKVTLRDIPLRPNKNVTFAFQISQIILNLTKCIQNNINIYVIKYNIDIYVAK